MGALEAYYTLQLQMEGIKGNNKRIEKKGEKRESFEKKNLEREEKHFSLQILR